MPPFREVAGARAGPHALGILVPPGRRTLVVIRPRALNCDLLMIDPGADKPGLSYWEIDREKAFELVERLHQALEESASGGTARVEAMASPAGEGYQVLAAIGPFSLMACARLPGQPYEPLIFATVEEAQKQAERLATFLFPAADANQELYFNERDFSR